MTGLGRFLRDERGSQTVEFVVWFPLWFFLIVMITDASLLYYAHTEMSTVARDTARRLTSGSLKGITEAQNYAMGQLGNLSYVVNVDYNASTTMAVQISVPVYEVIPFGRPILQDLIPQRLTTRVAMRSEPNLLASAGGSSGGNGGGPKK